MKAMPTIDVSEHARKWLWERKISEDKDSLAQVVDEIIESYERRKVKA
jgi:hypothetical protein